MEQKRRRGDRDPDMALPQRPVKAKKEPIANRLIAKFRPSSPEAVKRLKRRVMITFCGLGVFILSVLVLGLLWSLIAYCFKISVSGLTPVYAAIYLFTVLIAACFVTMGVFRKSPLNPLLTCAVLIILVSCWLADPEDFSWAGLGIQAAATLATAILGGMLITRRYPRSRNR